MPVLTRNRSNEPAKKKAKTDKAESTPLPDDDDPMEGTSKDNGASGSSSLGATTSGVPLPILYPQHVGQVDSKRVKGGGTIWIPSANNGTNDNLWTKFPWEFFWPFINNDMKIEMSQSHLYWKCGHIEIAFKNPVVVQEISNQSTGLVQAGSNNQAQVYMYKDTNMVTGLSVLLDDESDQLGSEAQYNAWIASMNANGYNAGAIHIMGATQHPPYHMSSVHPDVQQMGMGPGQELKTGHAWHDPYWRSTEEFLCGPNIYQDTKAFLRAGFARFDEQFGTIRTNWTGPPSASNVLQIRSSSDTFNRIPTAATGATGNGHGWTQIAGTASDFASLIPQYSTYLQPNPIPKLWLQLQPQVGAITAGVSNSVVQLQYEFTADIMLKGRVPRQGVTDSSPTANPLGGSYGEGVTKAKQQKLPIFRPLISADGTP